MAAAAMGARGQLAQLPVKGLSEAKRNAEALFEARTVAEIREVEARTRRDIEVKKQQLRQLVGESYRDLIDSADKIVRISRSSGTVLSNVEDMQASFAAMARTFSGADALLHDQGTTLSRHEELHAIGGRVRHLVDTPEVIWGCLDSQQYFPAAQRYLRAQCVYDHLSLAYPAGTLATFPLLQHQWPLVQKFKAQVCTAATASLTSPAHTTSEQTLDALAALVVLNRLDSSSALSQLLTARRAAIQAQLSLSPPNSGTISTAQQEQSPAQVAAVLSQVAGIVQTTISQAGQLFLSLGSSSSRQDTSQTYMQQTCKGDDLDLTELLFGGSKSSNLSGTQGSGPEITAWQSDCKGLQEGLTALPTSAVQKAVVAWVQQLGRDVGQAAASSLQVCTSARKLIEVERVVQDNISTWSSQQTVSAPTGTGTDAALTPHPMHATHMGPDQAASGPALARDSVLTGSGNVVRQGSWEAVCEDVLGAALPLWQDLFQPSFLARAKELLSAGFAAIIPAVLNPLDVCLQQAAAAVSQPVGSVACTSWPMLPVTTDTKLTAGAVTVQHDSPQVPWSVRLAAGRAVSPKARGTDQPSFRVAVHLISQALEAQLLDLLQSALLLVGGGAALGRSDAAGHSSRTAEQAAGTHSGSPPGLEGAHARPPTLMSLLSGGPVHRKDPVRAAELEPFVQAQCADAAAAMATQLQSRLSSLSEVSPGSAAAATAEQALLVGRLCACLVWDGRHLPALLGPPDQWRQAVAALQSAGTRHRAAGSVAASGAVKSAQGGSKLQSLHQQLRSTAALAYRVWGSWVASNAVDSWQAALLNDDTLTSNMVPLTWQETVIAAVTPDASAMSDLDDIPVGDMRFALPACPSSATQALLAAACCEVRRAGDDTVPAEALQVLEWEVLGNCLGCMKQLTTCTADSRLQQGAHHAATLGSLAEHLTEKGVLQLLFDLRLVRDVLAGGRPLVSPGSPAVSWLESGCEAAALAALADRRKACTHFEQLLQERLDPIDWATYEPHLWAAVQRHYQRCALLYGPLIQLQRVHPEAGHTAAKSASGMPGVTVVGLPGQSTELNPLGLLPMATRFHYLPLASPGGLLSTLSTGHRIQLGSLSALGRLASGEASHSDLAGAYSFADLGTAGRAASIVGPQGSNKDAGRAGPQDEGMVAGLGEAAGGAFNALQARLGGGAGGTLGSLGMLLGDKAAEMTAMAQQRFDLGGFSDLGLSALGSAAGGLGSGLFSHLTRGATTAAGKR